MTLKFETHENGQIKGTCFDFAWGANQRGIENWQVFENKGKNPNLISS